MDGSDAIEMNRLALKRILASMIAMAGLRPYVAKAPTFPVQNRGGFP